MKEIKKFVLPVEKTERGFVSVYAHSLEEAIDFCLENSGRLAPQIEEPSEGGWSMTTMKKAISRDDMVNHIRRNNIQSEISSDLSEISVDYAYNGYQHECYRNKTKMLSLEDFLETSEFIKRINKDLFYAHDIVELMRMARR